MLEILQDILMVTLFIYINILHKRIANLEYRHNLHLDTHIDDDIEFGRRLVLNIDKEMEK